MPNINSLTYNGMKSTDLGVYVTGSGSFDAAEMDADKYEIAGRNGDLIIPKNRYKNIVVTYPAFIPKAFQEKAQSIRNWMRSAKAYARLEDTYDMEHYRLGLASGIQSFEPVNRNDASNFQLSFDCKPECFLKTGETPLPIEPEAHSYSGEIVSFETVAVDDMTKAEVSLSPIQSGSGDPSPTNVRPITGHTGATLNVTGVNAWDEEWEIGAINWNTGENSASTTRIRSTNYIPIAGSQSYYYHGTKADIFYYGENKQLIGKNYYSGSATLLQPSNTCFIRFSLNAEYGTTYNHDISINYPSTDHDYHAYVGSQYTSSFGQTVYGGTFDFVSGKLTVTMANIASYNGETIGEPWLSSMDSYAAGATPTTGAQVVHTITPTETTLTPAQVQTLLGLNNVWASDGTVEINYADPFNVDNPTYFEARPLFEITNPAQNDVLNVNGKTITFLSSYTGTVTIDCETMDCFSGYTNLNYLISATDFLVLNEGVNIVTWSGSGTCKMTPRWWEL